MNGKVRLLCVEHLLEEVHKSQHLENQDGMT